MSDLQVQIFTSQDGSAQLEVALDQETVWLNQAQMCELFGRERSVITKHIRNVFNEGELDRESVRAKFALTARDGKKYLVDHYNLDVIISVGYRVKSQRGVQFRQWATRVLKDHLVQGYDEQQLAEIGNKRCGSFLFLWYLRRNQALLAKPVEQLINDNTLVALALLVAESLPDQKTLMIRLIEHFILLREPAVEFHPTSTDTSKKPIGFADDPKK